MTRQAQQLVHDVSADSFSAVLRMYQDFRDPRHRYVICKRPSVPQDGVRFVGDNEV